jgi:hypothetical protein
MKTLKKIIIFIMAIVLGCFVSVIYYTSKPPIFLDFDYGLIAWSTNDYKSVKSISGIKTLYKGYFYSFDYLDSEKYIGLSFPYQHGDIMYYTSQEKDTGEECIIARAKEEISFLLSKKGKITYKKIYDNQLYYILDNDIRRFDLNTGKDIEIISNVQTTYGFDINSRGEILYTVGYVMLLNSDYTTAIKICDGKAAKFIDDDNIIYTNTDRICCMNLGSQNITVIREKVNCIYILLTPTRTHAFYINMTPAKDAGDMFTYETLYVMLLNGKNHNVIHGYPHDTYGIEWINLGVLTT